MAVGGVWSREPSRPPRRSLSTPAVTTWVTSASRARLAGWRTVQWRTPGQGTSLPRWQGSVPPGSATTGRSGAWSVAITVPTRWSTPRGDRPCSSGAPIRASSRIGPRPRCSRSGSASTPAGQCRPQVVARAPGPPGDRAGAAARRPWRGPTPVRSLTCSSPCTAPVWGSPGRATCRTFGDELVTTLTLGGNGYCSHDAMRAHDADTRRLARPVRGDRLDRSTLAALPSGDVVHCDLHAENVLVVGGQLRRSSTPSSRSSATPGSTW